MGTSYLEIYNSNNVIKNDPRLSNLDNCELNSIRFNYLKFSISYFMYDCRKNLLDKVDPVEYVYEFIGDGVDNQFSLTPEPASNSMFVVYVGGNIFSDYSFDSLSNIMTLEIAPVSGEKVIIKSYTYGSFNIDLDIREINILAEGMNVPYLEETKNDENAMKYMITGKSIRFFSQANHIAATTGVVNSQKYDTVDSLISEYTYKGSVDKYKGLGGRGGGS